MRGGLCGRICPPKPRATGRGDGHLRWRRCRRSCRRRGVGRWTTARKTRARTRRREGGMATEVSTAAVATVAATSPPRRCDLEVARAGRDGGRPAGAATAARGGAPSSRRRRRRRWPWPPSPLAWRPAGVGARPTLPPPHVVVAPAGGRPPSTPRMCVRGTKPLLAAPMVAGAAWSAPPHSAWQRRWVRVGCPADRWGGGSRSSAPRAAPRTEAPRVCFHGRGSSGAPPTPHARG